MSSYSLYVHHSKGLHEFNEAGLSALKNHSTVDKIMNVFGQLISIYYLTHDLQMELSAISAQIEQQPVKIFRIFTVHNRIVNHVPMKISVHKNTTILK